MLRLRTPAMWLKETAEMVPDIHRLLMPEQLSAFVLTCPACQKRFKAKKHRFSVREDDLVQEHLDEEFGPRNMFVSSSSG
jgi:hypothetical protein